MQGTGGAALRSQGVAAAGRQERPKLREHFAPAWAQEAVGADCGEPLGEHRWEEAVEEGFGEQRQAFPPGAAPLREAESDVPVFQGFQAVGGEGNPVEIGSEGGEDLHAGARRLAVGPPVLVPDLGRHGSAEASSGQRRLELPTAKLGQGTDGHQPGRRAGGEPLQAFC